MSKSLFSIVLSFILIGIFLPSVSSATANSYFACPREQPFYDGTQCCEEITGGTCKNPAARVSICYEGFVPCGLGKPIWEEGVANGKCSGGTKKEGGISCQFCHFFVMLNGIVNFVLINVVPYLAVLMLVAGGVMFYFGGGKPDLLTRGKKLITGVIIGLFLIYGSYMIVGIFLSVLGVSEWTGLANWAAQGPFSITCDIY